MFRQTTVMYMIWKIRSYLTELSGRKGTPRPFDYAAALKRLTIACEKCTLYSVVHPAVFFDTRKCLFCVHFECAMREFTNGETRKKYYLSVRRNEKLWSDDLERLLDFAVTYAEYDDAFRKSPEDNLPEGIKMSIKTIRRAPGTSRLPTLPKWRYQ